MVLHKINSPDDRQSQLEKIQPLLAFISGLGSSCDIFHPDKGEKPHDRLPILQRPAIVRATQLAILQLRDPSMSNPSYVQAIVEAYGGIEKRFREQLKLA